MNPNMRLDAHVRGRDRKSLAEGRWGEPRQDCVIVWICHEHGPETP